MLSTTSYFQLLRCIQLCNSTRTLGRKMQGVGRGWRSQPTCWTNYFSNHVFFFFLPQTSLTPAIFVSNQHFHKKCAYGKPSSQTSGYGLNTVSFLFGSGASCMNVCNLFIYLFIYNHWIQIFKFLSKLLYVETNGNGTKLLRQLLTIKLILLLIGCSEISVHASNV